MKAIPQGLLPAFSDRTRKRLLLDFWHRVSGEALLHPTRMKTVTLGSLRVREAAVGTHRPPLFWRVYIQTLVLLSTRRLSKWSAGQSQPSCCTLRVQTHTLLLLKNTICTVVLQRNPIPFEMCTTRTSAANMSSYFRTGFRELDVLSCHNTELKAWITYWDIGAAGGSFRLSSHVPCIWLFMDGIR